MNLYHISQSVNTGYDTYSDAVVAAETENEARFTHPSEYKNPWDGEPEYYDCWCAADKVNVRLIGVAADYIKPGIICASFHAG